MKTSTVGGNNTKREIILTFHKNSSSKKYVHPSKEEKEFVEWMSSLDETSRKFRITVEKLEE